MGKSTAEQRRPINVSATEAKARFDRGLKGQRLALAVTIASATVSAFFFLYLFDDGDHSTATITSIIFASIAVVASQFIVPIGDTYRYRIPEPRARVFIVVALTIWLLIFVATGAIGFVFDDHDNEFGTGICGMLLFALLIVVLPGILRVHSGISSRLLVGYPAIRAWTQNDWDHVDAIVVAGADGQVHLGVRVRPGGNLPQYREGSGDILTDIPGRIVVDAARFNLSHLCWATNLTGRSGITIYERFQGRDYPLFQSNSSQGPPQPYATELR
ncbi:hypothetical protein [Gordonia sputi]